MPDKDAGLRIRVERDLREKFQETCREQGEPAAQVLRQFMREYVRSGAEQKPRLMTVKVSKLGTKKRKK